MHGFPDNLHLYDRLSPHLSPPRRVDRLRLSAVGCLRTNRSAFRTPRRARWSTWMRSSPNWASGKSSLSRTTPSGPPAIELGARQLRSRGGAGVVEHVLLCNADASPAGSDLAVLDARGPEHRAARVGDCSVTGSSGGCISGRSGDSSGTRRVRDTFVPLLYQQFDATPSARPAFFQPERGLAARRQVGHRTGFRELREFGRPVRIIFGDADALPEQGRRAALR